MPSTVEEADAIAALFPNTRILSQQQASENAIKQLISSSILHIATHGFFLSDVEVAVPTEQYTRGASFKVTSTTTATITAKTTSQDLAYPLLRSSLALASADPRSSDTASIVGDRYVSPSLLLGILYSLR